MYAHTHVHTHVYLRLYMMDGFVSSRNPDVSHQLLMYISARMHKICINNLCVSCRNNGSGLPFPCM